MPSRHCVGDETANYSLKLVADADNSPSFVHYTIRMYIVYAFARHIRKNSTLDEQQKCWCIKTFIKFLNASYIELYT